MKILQPTTMLTDYALGALTTLWAAQLFWQNRRNSQCSRFLWAAGFVATAIASFLGGSVHGFKGHLSKSVAGVLWTSTLLAVGVASWLMLSAIICACARQRWRQPLLIAAAAKLVVFVVWSHSDSSFRHVIYDYVTAMVIMLLAEIHAWISHRAGHSPWIVSGVLIAFFAALVQTSRFALHAHFNHNDLFHVIQMGASYLFYRGGQRLFDRT